MSHPERAAIQTELSPPYVVSMPKSWNTPFVLSSPHSGRVYPASFLAASRLDAHALRKSEDYYVDELMAPAAALGAPLIAARFPRAYLDVNREPYELDPNLFRDRLPDFANTQSIRVAGGLGTIARIVSESEEIYREPLRLSDAFERIDRLYRPYHTMLSHLLDQAQKAFGVALLIDCHSMPSVNTGSSPGSRPDIVIGDRFGSSCMSELSRLARDAFAAQGFHVVMNRPYAGGFITEHYGRPTKGVHALQIEINRSLYVNEEAIEKLGDFDGCAERLRSAFSLMIEGISGSAPLSEAAE